MPVETQGAETREGSLDTIYAHATSAASAERGILRISGAAAFDCVRALVPDREVARARRVIDVDLALPGAWSSCVVLPARLVLFPGPASYTGDDVVEIHTMSSPPIVELLQEAVARHGPRLATPGEFTRRAFENGKLDLAQAEAVIALIRAEDDDAIRRASRQLRDRVDETRDAIRVALVDVIALLESGLDFAEGETGLVEDEEWVPQLEALLDRLESSARHEAAQERAARPSYVLCGPPNAGKTSLANALRDRLEKGSARGLVSPLEGTTRDLRWYDLESMRLADAPGRFEWAGVDASDRELAILRSELARVDGYVWVLPLSQLLGPSDAVEPPRELGRPALRIATQADLVDGIASSEALDRVAAGGWIVCSAQTGSGLEAVSEALARLGTAAGRSQELAVDLRERLRLAAEAVARALELREVGHELVVAELAAATAALAPSDAADVPEELLDRIFSRFCLGK